MKKPVVARPNGFSTKAQRLEWLKMSKKKSSKVKLTKIVEATMNTGRWARETMITINSLTPQH